MSPNILFNPNTPKAEDIVEVTKNPDLIKIYANGFQCTLTLADAAIVLKHNNVNVAMVTCTLSAIKTLHAQLGQVIQNYQNDVGQTILSFDELLPQKYKDQLIKK